ncbi:TNT domain-containing protein [Streptomyces sp. CAU 1734]|uniref:TNT domain-containing protein n=1 Tax=Streptomyces sp. CAU 1734 TaxID=3140360 RepID=UPI00325FE741
MKSLRVSVVAVGAAAALFAAPSAVAAEPEPVKHGTPSGAAAPESAVAGAVNPAARPEPCTGVYRDDARLGPDHLARKRQGPVGPLLKGYNRTGGLGAKTFLKKYWEGPADTGGWKYPPNDGFAEVNGEIDRRATALVPGQRLDRFGSEFGSYLAPAGDSCAKRALPPQNLNTREPAHPCDYRVYRVARTFTVWQGSIAPWFGQPGGGRQIKLDPLLLNPGAGQRLSVKWLLENGYLTHATAERTAVAASS